MANLTVVRLYLYGMDHANSSAKTTVMGVIIGGSFGGGLSYWIGLTLEAVTWPYGEGITVIGIGVVWGFYSIYLRWLLQVMTKRKTA